MAPQLRLERTIAELAVFRAAALTKKVLSTVQEISKEDASPVTVADFAAQALLISALHAAFPDDAFVGEEDSAVLRRDAALRKRVYELVLSCGNVEGSQPCHGTPLASPASEAEMLDMIDLGGRGLGGRSGRFWVMDPVDGTATFLRGEQYAVSLALMEDGKEVLGVLCCPNLKLTAGRVSESSVDTEGLGVMLSAVKGQGVSIRTLSAQDVLPPPQPLDMLRPPASLADVHLIDCSTSKSSRQDILPKLAQTIGAQYPTTDIWSSHVRYASLVVGGGDVLLRVPANRAYKSYIWDHAGAQLIYSELGGKVTDVEGKPVDFGVGRSLDGNWGVLAAHADIHEQILKLTQELLAD